MENAEIIAPVPREELEAELNQNTFVRNTNKGGNKIYDFSAHEAPALMKEVGRLREISFREAGGGTGKALDIDDYDTAEVPYRITSYNVCYTKLLRVILQPHKQQLSFEH